MTRRLLLAVLPSLLALTLGGGCGGGEERDAAQAPEPKPAPSLIAAGDVAGCGSQGDEATAELLDALGGTILVLGDTAYETGMPAEFEHCYGPTWGRHKERTRPAPGNHEYETPEAEGYFDYFGGVAGDDDEGYYSFDVGGWHVVALNSNQSCEEVACEAGSEQERWLREDLAANKVACTLAYLHHPLFSAVKAEPSVRPLWDALHEHGVDVVLAGHSHNYQRFAPLTPAGEPDARGIRQFVVGTGGRELDPIEAPAAHTEAWNDDTWGVLSLSLRDESYGWRFVPVEGGTFTDRGSGRCH